MQTRITGPSQQTIDWIHTFFQRTSVPRMDKEKVTRIIEKHNREIKGAV